MPEFLLEYGLLATFAAYGSGALLSLFFSARNQNGFSSVAAHASAALASIFGLAFSFAILYTGNVWSANFAHIGIDSLILNIQVDSLAAIFIGLISIVSLAASIYGIGYQKQFYGTYRLGAFGFFYNTFLAGMLLVVSANDGILFLLAWELMAIASYFLVVFERNEEKNINAGLLYILISQIGAAFLFAAFLILYRFTGSWSFDAIRDMADTIPVLIQNIVLGLALVGFSSKAGVIPLHIWLPEAHPAAPSHVSALMSGVMIKTAIFMIIRFFIEFFPSADANWGMLILVLGAISSLLGVLYALSEHDIKRLLAFHSVENIGIILLGLGASITFFSYDVPALGIAALVAALYHTVNHAIFKALLFLSAGSVVHATHTRNMEEYGGLIKVMPWTAGFFLIGALAISGLPPLNGFVSEWLTFQNLFLGIASLPLFPKIVFLIGVSSLAFTGGLAVACFVKAFGATFLARPRGHTHGTVRESAPIMHIGMGFLAVLIVVLGVGAGSITPVFAQVAEMTRGLASGPILLANPAEAIRFGDFSALSMVSVAVVIGIGVLVTFVITWFVSRKQKVSVSRTWDCGTPLGPRMEITATGFSKSILTVFRGLLRPSMQTHVEYEDANIRYFPKSKKVHFSLPDFYRIYLYQPVVSLVERTARETRRVQTGNLNTYLLYMFATLILLLYWTLR